MTNLLILNPDIQQSCTSYKNYTNSASETPYDDEDMGFLNCMRGERYQHWKSLGARSEHNGVWDLGSSATKSCNFVVLSRLDYLRSLSASSTIDFKLQSSSDDSAYTDRSTITGVTTATLSGPWSNDYVTTFTATSAFRYWRAKFVKTAGADFTHRIGKVYFGTAFDLGKEAEPLNVRRVAAGAEPFVTSGGVVYPGRVRHPTYDITLRWDFITDANIQRFYSTIAAYRHTTPVFLYTSAFHDILENRQLIHCKLVEVEYTQQYTDVNTLICRFIEVHG